MSITGERSGGGRHRSHAGRLTPGMLVDRRGPVPASERVVTILPSGRRPDPVPAGPPSSEDARTVRGMARGGAANLVGAVVTTLANLLLAVVVARALDTTDAGVFFTTTSLVLLLSTLGRLGTGNGLVYFLPRLRVTGSPAEVSAALRLAFRPTLIASTVIGAVLFLLAPQVAALIAADRQSDATLVLRLVAVALPFASIGDVFQSATRGFNRMRTTVVVEKIARPLAQLVLIVVAAPTGSAVLLVLAWTVPYLPATLASWLPVRRFVAADRRTRSDRQPSGFGAAEFWRFTAPRGVASLAQIMLQRLDVILVAVIVGSPEAALYAAATRFLVVGQFGNQAISLALQPRLSAALARRDLSRARFLYQTSTSWLVLLTWPLYLVVLLFPAALLSVFGRDYTTATDVVLILCSAMLVATACGQVDSVLMMAGKSSWNMGNATAALVVDVVLNVLLLPHLGITGAAVAWAAAILVNNLVPLSQVWWSTRLHPFGRGTLSAALAACLATAVGAGSVRLVAGDAFLPALLAGVLTLVVWAALVWLLRGRLGLTVLLRRVGSGNGRDSGPTGPGPSDAAATPGSPRPRTSPPPRP